MSARPDRTPDLRPDATAAWILPLAAAAVAVLLAMIAITALTGVSQEAFEIVRAPDAYAEALRAHPGAVRAVFAVDTAFLVLYTALLLLFGRLLAARAPEVRPLAALAVGAIVATAVLDMIEDHHVLAMLHGVEAGSAPTAGQLAFQHTLSQVKFNVSYLGLFAFGLAVPRDTRAGRALAALLTAGTLVQGAWLYAAPAELLPLGNVVRWLSFVIGFALMARVAWTLRRRPAPLAAAAAAATGAPA